MAEESIDRLAKSITEIDKVLNRTPSGKAIEVDDLIEDDAYGLKRHYENKHIVRVSDPIINGKTFDLTYRIHIHIGRKD